MRLDQADICQTSSPNCGLRKHGRGPDMVVLHYTAMETAQAAIDRLCDPIAQVSAHYVISETGDITQLVAEEARAWHAGAGAWGGVSDVNSHSIGIEMANQGPQGHTPNFPSSQMAALHRLLADILRRHKINPARVIGHSDMAPGRKFDPGPYFDWHALAQAGLSVWPTDIKDAHADWDRFKRAALRAGYRAADTDTAWSDVLGAVRLRFCPHHAGDLMDRDVAVIEAYARDYPCAHVDQGLDPTDTNA